MARAAGLSVWHFSRAFRRAFGELPHQYLLTRRLERAASLLRQTDRQVVEICYMVGLRSVGSSPPTSPACSVGRPPPTGRPTRRRRPAPSSRPASGASTGARNIARIEKPRQAAYEELRDRGVEFTELPERYPYGIDAGFRDPSGNSFRLTQLAEGF